MHQGYSRCFNALKVVTEKTMVVKLPLYNINVSHLTFTRVSYSPMGNEVVLEFAIEDPFEERYKKFKDEMARKHNPTEGPYLY